MRQTIAIIALCVGSAVIYGILHDQITARVCLEYFTIGHPRVFRTESPMLLAVGWGVIATWWVGLILGIPLAVSARAGGRPKRDVRSLLRPVIGLMAIAGVCAALAGIAGYALGGSGLVYLVEPLASRVPIDRHNRFMADLWDHSARYLVGFIGGITVIVWVWRSRGRQLPPAPPAAKAG